MQKLHYRCRTCRKPPTSCFDDLYAVRGRSGHCEESATTFLSLVRAPYAVLNRCRADGSGQVMLTKERKRWVAMFERENGWIDRQKYIGNNTKLGYCRRLGCLRITSRFYHVDNEEEKTKGKPVALSTEESILTSKPRRDTSFDPLSAPLVRR